jgi:hypothetical protein
MRFIHRSSRREMLRQIAAVSFGGTSAAFAQSTGRASAQQPDLESKNPLNLPPFGADGDAEYTFKEAFSLETALSTLESVGKSLRSFRELTDATKKKQGIPPSDPLPGVEQTGWEMQNLGFWNSVTCLKGTLLKQDYLIRKLEYELAQQEHEGGKISQPLLDRKRKEYERAVATFKAFWSSSAFVD